jgi:hypothetical protein
VEQGLMIDRTMFCSGFRHVAREWEGAVQRIPCCGSNNRSTHAELLSRNRTPDLSILAAASPCDLRCPAALTVILGAEMEGQAEAASEGDPDTRRGSPAVATGPAPPRTAAAPVDVLPPRTEEERSLLHSAPVQHVSSSTWYAMDVQGSDDGRPSPRKPLGFGTAGLPRSSDPLLRHSALQAGTLPGGITARERLYMVTLFTATASLLYADQNLMVCRPQSVSAGQQARTHSA